MTLDPAVGRSRLLEAPPGSPGVTRAARAANSHRARAAALLCAALVAAFVAACATPRDDAPRWSGRLAVRVEAASADAAPRALGAQFELWGSATEGRLDLSTPIGTRIGEARWAPGAARLVAADGSVSTYPDLDAMTFALLGEALPVAALFDWLAGRPWPGAASEAAPGGFRQLGWVLDLSGLGDRLLVARREAGPGATLRVKLDDRQDAPR